MPFLLNLALVAFYSKHDEDAIFCQPRPKNWEYSEITKYQPWSVRPLDVEIEDRSSGCSDFVFSGGFGRCTCKWRGSSCSLSTESIPDRKKEWIRLTNGLDIMVET